MRSHNVCIYVFTVYRSAETRYTHRKQFCNTPAIKNTCVFLFVLSQHALLFCGSMC